MSEIPDVTEVRPLGAHRLHLRFDDGVEGEVDLSRFLEFRGVFEPLQDEEYFARVRVEKDLGTITWPNGADLEPVVLHSLVTGRPVPDLG